VVKLLVGILKGAIIGGGIGYGAYALGLTGAFDWITYGLVGVFVGLLVGRPLWSLIRDKNATTVIGILKALFGFGVGCGLYAIIAKAWGGHMVISGMDVLEWQPTLGGAIGAVYGGFVELDDAIGGDDAKEKDGKPAKKPAPKNKQLED
jgi:hypothetical protein